jgi:phytoene/squalene synthetase
MENDVQPNQALAADITRIASRQTYYTVRFLVDSELVQAAYQAYAYFRWVDDQIDRESQEQAHQMAFIHRQKKLVESCYAGATPRNLRPEERLLADLVRLHPGKGDGLQAYIRNMMRVMAFDAERRGRLVTQVELEAYTHWLAVAVTEALHYFIGHDCSSPDCPERYQAAKAAHITHMLRDTYEDVAAGYYNIPAEYLRASHIQATDFDSPAYRKWVCGRVGRAREGFYTARHYLSQVENPRCRLAGYAYMGRFETVLDTIEGDDYHLRESYPERKSLAGGLKISGAALWQLFTGRVGKPATSSQPLSRLEER